MRRVAMISGASRGIGLAIARELRQAGLALSLGVRRPGGFSDPLAADGEVLVHPYDAHDRQAAAPWVDATIARFGRIDVLVNNAGVSAWRALGEIDESFWNDMFDTNLKSVVFSCQSAAPHLPRGGSIINISSLAGKRGSANNSVYCATKFGVNGITQALAKELGPSGIRVNAVCPVYVLTSGLEEALAESRSPTGGRETAAYLAEFAAGQTALGVLPTDVQVAATCVFLASPAAGAITGQCVNVDCGVLPQ